MLRKKTGSVILSLVMMTAVVFSIAAFSPEATAKGQRHQEEKSITEVESSVGNVNLGMAGDFALLSKTGVSTTGTTLITGNIGVSPAAGTYMTGFDLILDANNEFSTSSLVVGKIFAADYSLATPSYLTTAVLDMEAAYTDAAGRTPDYIELYAGDLSGKTLTAGVYKYSNNVSINTDLTLNGDANDVFIFQIAGTLTQASATNIILTGGLLAENIIWQVADVVAIGTTASFSGTILAKTAITLNTGAVVNGKLLAQTAVTMIANKING
jgi:hypothetical protein